MQKQGWWSQTNMKPEKASFYRSKMSSCQFSRDEVYLLAQKKIKSLFQAFRICQVCFLPPETNLCHKLLKKQTKKTMEDMKMQRRNCKKKTYSHFSGSLWCFRIFQPVNFKTFTGSVHFRLIQEPASTLRHVWSVWRRLGIHHSKHLAAFVFFLPKVHNKNSPCWFVERDFSLWDVTASCQMATFWIPETTDFTLFFSHCSCLLIVLWVWFYKNAGCECSSFYKVFCLLASLNNRESLQNSPCSK